jgi:hypothetical protein
MFGRFGLGPFAFLAWLPLLLERPSPGGSACPGPAGAAAVCAMLVAWAERLCCRAELVARMLAEE